MIRAARIAFLLVLGLTLSGAALADAPASQGGQMGDDLSPAAGCRVRCERSYDVCGDDSASRHERANGSGETMGSQMRDSGCRRDLQNCIKACPPM